MESYEGGTATPFIVHWPNGLKDRENSINRSLAHIMDLMPTLMEVSGAEFPEEINGVKPNPLEGKSMMPLFKGESTSIHDTLYWEHQGGKAIRTNEWKMSALPGKEWELFWINKDFTETKNLADQYPEQVEELNIVWNKWAVKLGINHPQK
ncbi:sulfatase/phosphatase domain-containing protein [Marinilabilia salmonicolor]|nr:sulfatase/phosphatase domain-containing protein [Marinilabilia salmonicolor]